MVTLSYCCKDGAGEEGGGDCDGGFISEFCACGKEIIYLKTCLLLMENKLISR